jgi:hypothetical protein
LATHHGKSIEKRINDYFISHQISIDSIFTDLDYKKTIIIIITT